MEVPVGMVERTSKLLLTLWIGTMRHFLMHVRCALRHTPNQNTMEIIEDVIKPNGW